MSGSTFLIFLWAIAASSLHVSATAPFKLRSTARKALLNADLATAEMDSFSSSCSASRAEKTAVKKSRKHSDVVRNSGKLCHLLPHEQRRQERALTASGYFVEQVRPVGLFRKRNRLEGAESTTCNETRMKYRACSVLFGKAMLSTERVLFRCKSPLPWSAHIRWRTPVYLHGHLNGLWREVTKKINLMEKNRFGVPVLGCGLAVGRKHSHRSYRFFVPGKWKDAKIAGM